MGHGIAVQFASNGFKVILNDVSEKTLASSIKNIETTSNQANLDTNKILGLIETEHSLDKTASNSDFVVEAVFENAQESGQAVNAPVNEPVVKLESEIENPGNAEIVISFNSAFAAARKQFGPGKTFVYKSKEYSTSYAEELNNDSVNFAEDQKENINADEILAETSGTIGTIVFSHTDKPND